MRLWAGWCCSETDGEGLWWTPQYPEEMWLQALADLAQTHLSNPRVIGIDLRQASVSYRDFKGILINIIRIQEVPRY